MHLILFEHCRPNTVELISPFLAIKVLRLLYTSGFNVIKNRIGSIIFFFFNFQRRMVTSGDDK